MAGPPGAQIVDRGFQRYDGPRAGVGQAVRSVAWQSIRSTLGLGRPARHKIFPVLAIAIAYIPAIAFVGLSVIVGDILDPNEIADYASYYGFITAAILLFAGLVAPEVLVGDRRNGMLAMYLSTPLHRGHLSRREGRGGAAHARDRHPRAAAAPADRLHVRERRARTVPATG